MPTPSAPNSQASLPFNSTCPDPDEQQTPQSPSSWHPRPPPPFTGAMDVPGNPPAQNPGVSVDDDAASRSTTMSPRPHSSAGRPEREADLAGAREGHESQKQSETDDEFVARSVIGDSPRAHTSLATLRRHRGNGRGITSPPVNANGETFGHPGYIVHGYGYDEDIVTPTVGSEYSGLRVIPSSPSSFLRPGSRFHGTQQSERQVYDVQVEIKHVDLRESFLCGYLRIQGLTEDHPTLTTYFEGEIIGTKYGFITKHESWGASDKIDLSHWSKFPAFRPFSKQARKGSSITIKDVAQREHIFMRWKEHFLVPDHRVRTINGASFEGFYYICFNQIKGEVNGIYFHSKSEKFQQLELKHVEDRGCFGAMEFR
ncbi:Glucose-induced degradation protein 4 [Pleurostoma richardsiae]|uniref:Glucose-induced degradation protein 4 n=1 Tax=Pleurostoma richardsiae TaxID=41990 RepID=A0AA38RY25_9PEZI|nr:Glucose-induced degradation protein 4 [Pleurostoma richardsiae]